jgi:hypothetical protein
MKVRLLQTFIAKCINDDQEYILIRGTNGYVDQTHDGQNLAVIMDHAMKPLAGGFDIANQQFIISAQQLEVIE